ncbi:30S ribosome-binding factor RbfA [bacterium]|nr:30S ribosome-binding factor RbfA [bacterium]
MAGSRRIHRVNDLLQEVANEVMRQVKDPAVEGALITITSVNVSPDLSSARFYVTVMGKPVAEVVEGLNRASGFFRREITRQVSLKRVPSIQFLYDDTLDHAMHMQKLLHQVAQQTPPAEEEEQS